MGLTVKQAATRAGKSTSTIRRWIKEGKIHAGKDENGWKINELSLESYLASKEDRQSTVQITSVTEEIISQIATKVAAEIKPLLEKTETDEGPTEQAGNADHHEEINTLRQENEALKSRVSNLEAEIVRLQSSLASLASKLHNSSLPKTTTSPKPTTTNEEIPNKVKKEDSPHEVDEDKAEKWVREHTDDWLDNSCPFQRAGGRSWQELAQNIGPKISIHGKGEQSPRAYLHAIENWKKCNPWARLKAKVALEVVKKIEPANHYNHPVEIGG